MWIQLNWWVGGLINSFIPPAPHSHVALPPEIVRSNMVVWIPSSIISDIVFVFHYTNIINGVYGNTHGLKNTYFCRYMWDSNTPTNSFLSHPYYSLFSTNRVESCAERTWGVIQAVQDILYKLMASRGSCQKLNQSVSVKLAHRDWKIVKGWFNQSNFFLAYWRKHPTILHKTSYTTNNKEC